MRGGDRQARVYEAAWFGGTGSLQGEQVRCLTAQAQALCHTGYALDDEGCQDMAALHRRFGVELLSEQRLPVQWANPTTSSLAPSPQPHFPIDQEHSPTVLAS
ncbi:nucleotidyltransferase domain-containing protein [Peterkaempfera sp. SMS 1(5)a]|uniref:nucleotidyltransferase domain-containing protein n=1 Tax=Peterkaempfera podocarpi TaxID=3232308 RepID=UPI00366C53E5